MKVAVLERRETSDQGTFGRIVLPGGLVLYTGELPWRENMPNVSCIPSASYRCSWTFSEHFRMKKYLIESVQGRSGVRFHAANLMGASPPFHAQLNGCIALGEKIGFLDGQRALLVSAPAVTKFERVMAGLPFTLEIKNLCGHF